MDILDKAAIFRFHNKLLLEFGKGSTGTLGWKHPTGQTTRFELLSGIGDLNNCSVLDVGCGHGDLCGFLNQRFQPVRYYGVEQIPFLLEEALDKYSHLPETYFFEGHFSTSELPMVDYILACGALSYRNSDNLFLLKVIEKLFKNCRKGFGFNLLQKIDPPDGLLEAYKPEYVLEFCKKLTGNIVKKEGYYEDDYTIFLYH